MIGESTLPILIGGIRANLALASLTCEQRERVVADYAAFVAPPELRGLPAIGVEVAVEPGTPFIDPAGQPSWQIETGRQADGVIAYRSFFEQGWIDRNTRRAQLVMRPNSNPENFLRVLYAWEVLEQGGLLLHASGVIRNGRGYVFFGRSGAGKTTIARLSQPCAVLSDDLVLVRPCAGQWWVCGVPFRGELVEEPRTNAAAPLAGVYALRQGKAHALSGLPPALAAAQLAACVPFVMADPHAAKLAIAHAAALATAADAQTLTFARDPGFWSLLE